MLVNLKFNKNLVELRIKDDGLGFEVENVTADHLGLGIMRERAQSIGAYLVVQSNPGKGTQVVLTWDGTNE